MEGPQHLTDAEVVDVVRQFPSFVAVYEGADLTCVLANDVARAIVRGRPFEGLPLREALPEFESQQIVDLVERVFTGGEPARATEWRVQLDDPAGGEPVEVFATFDAVPWRRDDGSLRGVITTGVLVTEMVLERRAATSQAAAAEQRYLRAEADVVELQRAMLPAHLPVLPDAVVAAHYVVASRTQAAGGDWFDAVVLPDRRLAAVVGDVVGHGLDASAAMAQLRAVLVELLVAGLPLADALRRLDAFARRSPTTRAATVAVVVLDLADGTLEFATQGHPAPLVVAADGAIRFLPPTDGRPLGTGDGGVPVAHDALADDEVVLVFSDGLVERPGVGLDDGLAELARVAGDAVAGRVLAAGAPAEPVERVTDLSLEVLTRTGTVDDTTVVALRRRTEGAAPFAAVVAGARDLSGLRRGLAEWLGVLGVDATAVGDVQLAVTEAVSNAVEHAYRGGPGEVTVSAALTAAGTVHCEVADRGTWNDAGSPPAAYRGRGLALIRHFGTDLRLDRGPHGTTVAFDLPVHRSAVLVGDGTVPALPDPDTPFAVEVGSGPDATVTVHGPVDMVTATQLAAAIGRAGRGGTRPVLVDLEDCTQLASAGVRVLLEAEAAGEGVTIRSGRTSAAVLRLVGLDRLVSVTS